MRGGVVAAWSLVALVLVAGVADSFIIQLARDNLANATFPRQHERTPWQLGLDSSNVSIPSDGFDLAGWWMPAPAGSANASTTIILVHGVSSQMGKPVRMWAPSLHAAGYSLLAFDLRNHGASPDVHGGDVTYGVDEARDVVAAVTFVQDHAAEVGVDPDRIVLYGGSMGAASVLNAAGQNLPGVDAVIADSSYASFSYQAHVDGAHKGYPSWIVSLVVQAMDDQAPAPPSASTPDEAIASIRAPVLLLHCSNDERVTQPNFIRLSSARGTVSGQPHLVWNEACPTGLSRDHHLDGFMQASYNATVLSFLEQVQHPAMEG